MITPRERVMNAIHFKPVDKAPMLYCPSDAGYYEHGEKLIRLYETHPDDFGGFSRPAVIPAPREGTVVNGAYYDRRTDEWGTEWEYRVFGMMGHAIGFPLKDWDRLNDYVFPAQPWYMTDRLDIAMQKVNARKERYLFWDGSVALLERLSALRGFENCLMDLYEDSEEVNIFLDRLTDYFAQRVTRLVCLGADGITLADDFGTQNSLILSRELFRSALKPRFKRILRPAVDAGLYIHLHSCGYIWDLLDDFKDLHVTSIWPQLPLFDMERLRDRLRELGMALQIHTDRAGVMTSGSPMQVKALAKEEMRVFDILNGGSWMHVETDTGFPFENVETLVKTISGYRRG